MNFIQYKEDNGYEILVSILNNQLSIFNDNLKSPFKIDKYTIHTFMLDDNNILIKDVIPFLNSHALNIFKEYITPTGI
jgi:hypothetical protein